MIALATESRCMKHHYNLNPIIETLNDGGLILYPTDTVWGIGCDATNSEAVEKVFDLKNRSRSKPFTILVADIQMLKEYVEHLHPRIETLLLYHLRPLTIIYDQAKNLPPISVGNSGSVAIRIPQDEFCKALLKEYGRPVVSSSANVCDQPFPKHFGEISSAIIQGVDYVVKHRQADRVMGSPSVIARLADPFKAELEFLRE